MSIDTFIHLGVYLKCTPRQYVIQETQMLCPNGHGGNKGEYCSTCGSKLVEVKNPITSSYCFYELTDEDIGVEITDAECDLLRDALFPISDMNGIPDGTELLGVGSEMVVVDPDYDDMEINDILPMDITIRDVIADASEMLYKKNILSLLNIIYTDVEVKFGLVSTHS